MPWHIRWNHEVRKNNLLKTYSSRKIRKFSSLFSDFSAPWYNWSWQAPHLRIFFNTFEVHNIRIAWVLKIRSSKQNTKHSFDLWLLLVHRLRILKILSKQKSMYPSLIFLYTVRRMNWILSFLCFNYNLYERDGDKGT